MYPSRETRSSGNRGNKRPQKRASSVLQKKIDSFIVKRPNKNPVFEDDSAPFHVPHNVCIDRIDKMQLDNTMGDTENLIYNFRAIERKPIEKKISTIQLRAEELQKHAKFRLPVLTLEEESIQDGGAGDEGLSYEKDEEEEEEEDLDRGDRITKERRILKKKQLPIVTDLNQLINNKIKKFTDNSFVYLRYTVPSSNEFFTPYSLVEVPYQEVDKNEFYTISRHGVTYWSTTENHFTELDTWLIEYDKYCKLMKIKTFLNFRIWKGFKVWQKTLQWAKHLSAKNFIKDNLFIVIPPLAHAILLLRTEIINLLKVNFIDKSIIENWYLFYFVEAQMLTYEKLRNLLIEFRTKMTDILYEACHTAIVEKGFLPVDEALTYTTAKKLKEMMSFTDRARKRRYCILLANFLSYCDYMTITMLHNLLHNCFADASSIFKIHDALSPPIERFENLALDFVLEDERGENDPKTPFMLAELVLKPNRVEVDPSREITMNIIKQLMNLINDAVFNIKRFQNDPFYNQFTEPSIMGRQEDRLCGPAPSLGFVVDSDQELYDDKAFITYAINHAYDLAELYVRRFEPIRINYDIDLNTDPKTIKAEKDLSVLRGYCVRYNEEMTDLEGLLTTCNIGLLQLKQGTFKEEVIPVCRDLLVVLDSHMPRIAVDETGILFQKVEELRDKLLLLPQTTLEYVDYIRFINKCGEDIDNLDVEREYVYQIFVLMKDYGVEVDDVEIEKYLDLEELINESRDTLNAQIDKRGEFVENLSVTLQDDIKAIFDEVKLVEEEVLQPWLIDDNSDPEKVKEALQSLYDRLFYCQEKSQEYRKYQREFKIDVTRFDLLDSVMQEVKLRQTLWESLDQWNDSLKEWYSVNFHELNMDDLTAMTAKILKNCTMLEKNLPSNEIVPKLRASAEQFKEKLPVIGYMRNPSLKMRHWIKIEQILNKKVYTDDSVTLNTFEEAGAFDFETSEELMEISGQASAEAGLEVLLKKVENAWKEFELSVVPHRDATDVFILAGIDELQSVLDESNININTIAASRHVGPIKSRVDEWTKLLDTFAQTLDEWMSCQQSWIYLEAIFSAPDIQRQLPNEAKMFLVVDKSWKDIMRKTNKMPLALPTMTDPDVLEAMQNNNMLLEKITKCLEAYLEVKRVAFPRFYFLSNDELLEILAQTRNPFAVQPHLRKCFDAIAKLEFGSKDSGVLGEPPILTTDIVGMISPEGEKVVYGKGLKARGPVEDWLSKVEEAMFMSLKRCMKYALQVYASKDRSEWFQDHANQIVLTISQQQWGNDVHALLDHPNTSNEEKLEEMKLFEKKSAVDLGKLATIARTDISKLLRKVLCALITIDVHNKDTITNMVKEKVCQSNDFNWLKMLRYYWVRDTETIAAKMASANLPYFYEYLGAGGVLVITPLTDRCYLCLMGALQMDLGGAPAGPAGTGKTETTKDLAKALAKQCVVFNCSEGLDYKMMGRFFSGLAQSGAWCCFDEFNRIDIEVLSVIAQQLITIRNAKAMRQMRFMFEGREIKLNMSCAAFITMNPGYAGRTELPDNLKALFRPMSMMVPDYALIAEVILYSEGFEASKILAQKMVQMYKLCSEQLSQQDHYDFGMRAVKSVLVMAGALKRAAPDQSEDITLIAALRDSNLPKFLADDALLFKGILGDLFPGVELPEADYGALQQAIVDCMVEKNLQTVPAIITKTIQLYETMCVRWGVMLVGPTGGGKTSVLHSLACALTKLFNDGVQGSNYRNVKIQTLNPKAVNLDELYGAVNSQTLEWKDGLLGLAVRAACVVLEEEHQWVVCDGPVDAVWIENMNTVLDDNKMLCLANSERIKLSPWVHMLFEVQDLSQASPATVSRCGMVYIDPGELGWMPIVLSWIDTLPDSALCEELKKFIIELYTKYLDKILLYARRKCSYSIHQVEVSKVSMSCTLIKTLTEESKRINMIERSEAETFITKTFFFSVLWSVGGNLLDESMHSLETYVRNLAEKNDLKEMLPELSLWEYRISPQTREWETWSKIVPDFTFDPEVQFFDMLVPTSDTARFGYIAELLFRERSPVMFTGDTGVGKSVLAKSVMMKLSETDIIPVFLNFSAQTSSKRTQEMIEIRLEKRKRTLLGAPFGKLLIVFVDDVNMPKLDTYGSQPPIELLRQFLDFKGLFDRDKMFWKDICDVILGCACAPPGGGRNPLTPRFVRHFALLLLPPPNNLMLTAIFSAIMTGFLSEFAATIRPLAQPMIDAAVDIYARIAQELLPTPAKSHYVFNLRDLSKCIQGVLQADSSNYNMPMQVLRLFYHEAMRVFHDRLINEDDKTYFKGLMRETCVKYFQNPIVKDNEVLLYGDFLIFGQNKEDRIYEEIKDIGKLKNVLMDYLEDYNGVTGKEMNLILFQDAIEHIIRLARLLRAERGNGLLVGLSGMGKQSLSRLSAHLNSYKSIQIELCRGYDHSSFHEDLRILYWLAGVKNTPTVFLITDTQIIKEEFLEDINNILNSGEVPNLFEGDEYEKVILGARDAAIEAKAKDVSRDGIFHFFINRVRANLHVVICMSPVGDAFRRRCRMFPSLVNCCTIDWFVKWPQEALYSVALGSLKEVTENEEECMNLARICVMMHETIEDEAERFYEEVRRHYYTTPSSYLELLKLYHNLLKKRSDIIIAKRRRIANGLNKILETNELVAVMQVELQNFAPMLEEQSKNMKELLKVLDKDTAAADIVRTNVAIEETAAKEIAATTQAIADDAAADLEVAMPALKAAQDALKALNKNDINELKVFQSPPRLVQFVMEAICILLGAKPDWASAKAVMADVNFLKRLFDYDAKHIPDIILKKIKVYVENKDFEPAIVEKVSKVAKSMCLWVRAIDKFAKVYRVVEPKVKRHEQAESELQAVMALLKKKQNELAQVESKIQALKDMLDEKNREFQVIQDNVDLTTGRLNRAGRLTSALSDEEVRWSELVEVLTKELWSIPGDVIVASACVAYLGAFSINYRRDLTVKWVDECRRLNIPSSSEFSLVTVLGDAYSIRNWNMHGLPRDDVSTENGIIVTNALRWPLMIDPQEQANRWIRSMEKENDLRILKMTDPNMMRFLEICIRQGYPLLIEEIEEFLDPTLAPILGRMTFVQGGRLLIKVGESNIDYDNNFRLYMTTKLSNPHYLPEVCIQVTLVNFLVTVTGLEDQLLADVVAIELPELEKQRSDLIVRINSDRQQLFLLEDKVLKLLFSSEGNILDDEELVETLNEAKETSAIIAARLIDTEQTEAIITATREKYRPLAARGAILFFVVAMLAEIDPMYQYSLKYFTSIFCSVIQLEHPKMLLEERLSTLMNAEIYAIYENISRGLFEKHKLVYSFLLAIAVEKQLKQVSDVEFEYLLRGPIGSHAQVNRKPPSMQRMNDFQWKCCHHLEYEYPQFSNLVKDIQQSISFQLGDFSLEISFVDNPTPANKDWNAALSPFEKLMLVNSVKDEKLIIAVGSYVRLTLGPQFTEAPRNSTLAALYLDTSAITPLVFVLSTGSDPMASLLRFAQDMNYMEKLTSISLGQGQGPAAESLIEKGRAHGHWIFLQNCHLATSWMANMEKIVRDIALGVIVAHIDFRLFMSSMPSTTFPVSVLQNSLKVTNEPPKGLRANMIRSLSDISNDYFENHVLEDEWRAMVFGVCMFHGVILERRKFGPLGWNITYEFSESDRECGLKTLDMFCSREDAGEKIPWDALEYINGEITWGGRVTDYWDQRCLKTILKIFSSRRILAPDYKYSISGTYFCPTGKPLSVYREYAANLPYNDNPDIFGMHENANIVFQTKETQFFLLTMLEGMPRVSSSSTGMSSDDICMDMIRSITKVIAQKVDADEPLPELIKLDSKGRVPSLTTVLMQETERFNKLLRVLHESLLTLEKAIKGFVVMSDALEAIFNSFLNNQVPTLWASKGYLSTKTLGYWVIDFQHRIDFIQTWLNKGLPRSSWLSGLFFPQSFLTGTLQTHARRHNLPIDSLKIDFEIMPVTVVQKNIYDLHLSGVPESPEIYGGLNYPETGIIVHGLFIEAARWDMNEGGLCDARLGELMPRLPAVWFKPCLTVTAGSRYDAPLYKTQVRAGVLSTTGHSTNFVLSIYLDSKKKSEFWILRGTALVTQTTE